MHPLAGAQRSTAGAAAAVAAVLAVCAALAACATLAACGGANRKTEPRPGGGQPAQTAPGVVEVQTGLATWYGRGVGTASGERFNPRALTAAHRTFPMQSRVRVTNQRNGRTVVVRINDRGPFVRGRIIDVSEAAAEVLGMKRDGVVPVKVERLR